VIGQTISHYKILEHLGGGGMGVVYRAQDLKLDRTVALKFLPPELTRDPEAKTRFVHEAKAASALQHDNICTIHDVDETPDGQLFIAMDCYEGETLKKKIERGPLPIAEAVDLATQVARGLAKAHEAGMVHRDIKPANIMVTKDGEAKIVDFGLAKLAGQTKLTRVGSTLGTVTYMSPEQARGEEVDHRSDIWSLGVVLYEMITGQPPFKSDYEHALVYSILNDEVRPMTALQPDTPPQLEEIIRKTLAKDPSARYQHIEEVEQDLRQLQKGGEITVPLPRLRRALSSPKGRRASMSGMVIAGCAALLIGYFVLRPGKTETPIKRLVVLPFENLGPAENEYFTDGMTEELTNRLSSLSGLRVISRSSATQYVKTNKTMQKIGEELGVDYALEGAVRWAPTKEGPSRVRITSDLTRISDRTALWAETYDRVIDDIFAVQSEISQKVVERLGITLLEPERRSVEEPPTRNLEAYQAFLRARYYENRPHFTTANWVRVVESYQQAVQLDSGFALAYAELARGHARLYYLWYDHSPARLEMANRAAERALALAPEMPAVHLALGYHRLYAERDPKKALEQFSIAEKGMPHNAEILEAKEAVSSMVGRWEEALESARQAFDLSPLDGSLAVDLGEIYWVLRRYEDAVRTCDRAIELTPDDAWPYLIKTFSIWSWKGKPSETQTLVEAVPTAHEWTPWVWYWQEMLKHDYRGAIARLSSFSNPWIRTKCWAMPKSLLAGYAYRLLGEKENSRRAYESARIMLETEVKDHPDDPRYHSSLGIACAALGLKKKAIQEGKKAVELLPISKDAFYSMPYIEDLAFIYTLTGETEAALDRLDYLLSIPSWISVAWLRMDPQWDLIRNQPGFAKLLEKHSGWEGREGGARNKEVP
jgi:serine/threonine protein kinase/tetratricopeptide (TPR) repeat protein